MSVDEKSMETNDEHFGRLNLPLSLSPFGPCSFHSSRNLGTLSGSEATAAPIGKARVLGRPAAGQCGSGRQKRFRLRPQLIDSLIQSAQDVYCHEIHC